nr:MAG TPA: hypothetical protein [Caudoviricetes sp.]
MSFHVVDIHHHCSAMDWEFGHFGHYLLCETIPTKCGIWSVEILVEVMIFVLGDPASLDILESLIHYSIMGQSKQELCFCVSLIVFFLDKCPESSRCRKGADQCCNHLSNSH